MKLLMHTCCAPCSVYCIDSLREEGIEPVYVEMEGWKTDMTHFTSEEQFPDAFKKYINFLEHELETPITIISIGPDREQTIIRK